MAAFHALSPCCMLVFALASALMFSSPVIALDQTAYARYVGVKIIKDEITSGQGVRSPGRAYMSQAVDAFIKSDLKKALTYADLAVHADPKLAGAYLLRAYIYNDLEQAEKAARDMEFAHSLEPNLVDVHFYDVRSTLNIDSQKWSEALADISKAIGLHREAWRLEKRGQIYYALGKKDLAVQDYTTAITLEPKDGGRYRSRGDLYASLNRYQEAIDDYTTSLKLQPENPACYGARANMYAKLGRADLAKKDREIANQQGFH